MIFFLRPRLSKVSLAPMPNTSGLIPMMSSCDINGQSREHRIPKGACPPKKEFDRTRKHRWYLGAAILGGILGIGLVALYFFVLEPSAPSLESPSMKQAEKETPVLPPAPPQIADTQPPAPAPPQVAGTNPPAPRITEAPPVPAPLSPQIGGTHSPAPSPPKVAGTSPPPASPSAQVGGITPSQKENPISLQLKAVETTWLSVKVDAEAEREMMLRPGESIPLEGSNQIYLLIGNAGGLDLIHNGKLLERFGKSGDVVALTFTRQGLDVKRIEKSKPQLSTRPLFYR